MESWGTHPHPHPHPLNVYTANFTAWAPHNYCFISQFWPSVLAAIGQFCSIANDFELAATVWLLLEEREIKVRSVT